MIEVEEAIIKSKEFAKKHVEDLKSNLKVDEIELDENEGYWMITLGWDSGRVHLTALESAMGFSDVKRKYRVFYVDIDSGIVKKMKLRE